jgi:outer membrane protein assembly factor BamB
MVDPVDEPWIPPRPPSYASSWGDTDLPTPPRPDPVAAPGPAEPHGRGSAGRGGHGRGALSAGRRILVSYLALVAAIGLVVAVGGALQPTYGALAPWQGVRVDDVRGAPAGEPWTVDLAASVAPGIPPECLRFAEVDVGPDLAAVRADGAWAYGASSDSRCSVVPAGFGSRVVVVDTATGDVRWVHDVGDDLGSGESVAVTWMSSLDRDARLLVRAGTSTQQVVETLSLATGRVEGTTGPLAWSQDDRFTASGRVVAIGSLSLDDLAYRYEMRDADDLSHVVWQGPGNETATLIALDDRLLLGGRGTVQVPLATGVATPWGGPLSTTAGYTVHDDTVFASNVRGHGVTTTGSHGFAAIDRTGAVLWRSDLELRGDSSVTRSCLLAADDSGDEVSCLDYRTGHVRWTTRLGAFSFAGSAPGQRSDDVYAVTNADHAALVALDGRTGRVRFQETVPPGSSVVAAGRTVAYVLAFGFTGARSTVLAVDTSSGHRLWERSSQVQLALWAGHVIDVGSDGLARRLT